MENIFFLVLVAAVALIRFVLQAAETKKNKEAARRTAVPTPNVPPARAANESEEERVRKFFEALGLPASAAAPPKTQPAQPPLAPPRMKRIFLPVDPFPVPRTSADLPSVIPSPAPPIPRTAIPSEINLPTTTPIAATPQRQSVTVGATLAPPIFEVHDLATTCSTRAARSLSSATETLPSLEGFVARLATPEGLREAIILREIFGPPRSMQPFAPDFAA